MKCGEMRKQQRGCNIYACYFVGLLRKNPAWAGMVGDKSGFVGVFSYYYYRDSSRGRAERESGESVSRMIMSQNMSQSQMSQSQNNLTAPLSPSQGTQKSVKMNFSGKTPGKKVLAACTALMHIELSAPTSDGPLRSNEISHGRRISPPEPDQ